MTDIHTHILPNVDDGARSMEESLALLKLLAAQGVSSLIATPHFYAINCVNFKEHLERVNSAFNALESLRQQGMPHIYLGHEVHYFKGISNSDDIGNLTLNNTNYLLLELPYADISSYIADEIIDLQLNRGITPVLAHIERYLSRRGMVSVFDTIKEGYALAHINCDSLLDGKLRKLCFNMIKDGLISFMASDTHSLEMRPPHMDEAAAILQKKFGPELLESFEENARWLISP